MIQACRFWSRLSMNASINEFNIFNFQLSIFNNDATCRLWSRYAINASINEFNFHPCSDGRLSFFSIFPRWTFCNLSAFGLNYLLQVLLLIVSAFILGWASCICWTEPWPKESPEDTAGTHLSVAIHILLAILLAMHSPRMYKCIYQ